MRKCLIFMIKDYRKSKGVEGMSLTETEGEFSCTGNFKCSV